MAARNEASGTRGAGALWGGGDGGRAPSWRGDRLGAVRGPPQKSTWRRARLSVLASEPDCLNPVQFIVADEARHAQFVPVVHAVEQKHEAHHVNDRKQCELASHPGPPWG